MKGLQPGKLVTKVGNNLFSCSGIESGSINLENDGGNVN